MSNTNLRHKPILSDPDEQTIRVENENHLLKNTAVRTRAKKNFKNRLSELDHNLKSDDSPKNEETKFIISPRMTSDDNEQTENDVKLKKKRGNLKKILTEKQTDYDSGSQIHVNRAYESDEDIKTEEAREEKPKKKVRKARKKNAKSESKVDEEEEIGNDPNILAIIVHKTDKLRTDINIYNPVVRIHLVDLDTDGQYVKKTKKDRNVLYFYDKDHKKSDHISPVMTSKFDFKTNKYRPKTGMAKKKDQSSIIPRWEELVVFNEEFRHFIKEKPNVLVLFELLDTHKPLEEEVDSRHNYLSEDTSKKWQRIAWAFLKIVGSDKTLNLEKKIRLQLYYSQTQYILNTSESLSPAVYYLYKHGSRVKYPSSLHVTIKSILAPKSFQPGVGSVHVFEQEEFLKNLEPENPHETYSNANKGSSVNLLEDKHQDHETDTEILNPANLKKNTVVWSRIAGLPCRIPNDLELTLKTPKKGCYSIKFSTSGSHLACACVEENNVTPVFIYEIPTGKLLMKYYGHFGLIYELSWSKLDKYLVTASNDATARVLDIEKKNSKEAYKLLPHPTFIYTVKFHPESQDILCTGGYDKVIRVWSISNKRKKSSRFGELLQEIFAHSGYINSLCFSFNGLILYSADSAGIIKSWNCFNMEDHSLNHKEWTLKEDIVISELKNQCISYIKLHPNQFRMVVHLRNNQLKLIDLRLQNVVQRYKTSFNLNQNSNSAMTPCGTFLFNSSADTKISCWNVDTADQITSASILLNYLHPARDMDFHPYDNLIAFCCYDTNAPIYVFKYDSEKAAKDLKIHKNVSYLDEPNKTLGADGTLLHTVQNEKTLKENSLQKKLADGVAKFNDYQLNRWKNVQEKLDSVYPAQKETAPNTARSFIDNWTKQNAAGSITLSMADDLNKKPEFKYRGPKEAQDVVIALYDYKSQRGDELDLVKGDQIKVLVRENESWWMGELVKNKQEGYFPANYVQDKSIYENLNRGPISPIKMPKFTVRDAMAEYNKTYEKDALKSITKGISLPESTPKGILTNQQMMKIKNNDNNQIIESTNKANSLAHNAKTSKDERPSSSSATLRPSSSADGNSSNTDTINEMPTRDKPTRKRDYSKRRPFAHIINSGHQSSSEA